jgi:conjugative relaxase-like TrwC/TraI family protein
VISIRRMTLGSGYRYLMESVAAGDGMRHQSLSLADYYAQSGTPPGIFLGAGLAALNDGQGVEKGSPVSEEHLFNLLGMCADPVTGKTLGRQPNRSHLSLLKRIAERMSAISRTAVTSDRTEQMAHIESEERAKGQNFRIPVAGFDLTFSPSKSVSTAWALADSATREQIYGCHREAIDVVLAYAEREVFHSRSGTNGVVQEDIEGVVATAFTHWDSRSGDPQLHDHVVVANRVRSVADGVWRTLDSRGIFKNVVMLSELHQGVLADLLTTELGWGWDGRPRRHSDQLRWEVNGVPEALMNEFSQRVAAIEERKDALISEFTDTRGRAPTNTEILDLRRRATLETRPVKEHRRLGRMTNGWHQRAENFVGPSVDSWVAGLAERNELPLLRVGDLADEILADAAGVAVQTVAERRATFTRGNVLAEVHRQFQGVRFASPNDRIAVTEHTADLALAQALLISAPELHHTPERLRRADGTSRFRAKGHEIYTTTILLEAEARLLEAGQEVTGPTVSMDIVAAVAAVNPHGKNHPLSIDQAAAVEMIATSGRPLDVLVGPAGTGKSTTMAGLRIIWEAEHGRGSVLGLAPSAVAAQVLSEQLAIDTENTAKWLHEHRREPERLARIAALRSELGWASLSSAQRSHLEDQVDEMEANAAPWRLQEGQLVIVDEASLAGTFGLDELVSAAIEAGAKVVLVGDHAQMTAVDAGGMFAALVRDRGGLAAELTDVHRFLNPWEKTASVDLRKGSPGAIDHYQNNGRIAEGHRDQMLDALYLAWKRDTDAGQTSLMIAGDLNTVGELNARAQGDRVAVGTVTGNALAVAGGSLAGVGDLVVTRQNNRKISTGKRWIRNGDQWRVTATLDDGSMTVQRVNGTGKVVLPADYVREHVELGYASTAHRAQGRTVDTAHAMVSPTTTREVLYVSATRGKVGNALYVDTHYDADPQTSHGETVESMTGKEVLVAVLRNEGAEVAAHDMIRREHDEAEGMERLSAEYLTLATEAQADRWESLLSRSGLSDEDLATVRTSEARGPLFAALRDVEARGIDVEAAVPLLIAVQSLADAADVASVLHSRVDEWSRRAGDRRQEPESLIAGIIPRAQGVNDADLARALAERGQAMEERAWTLAVQAIESRESWVRSLGNRPKDPDPLNDWLHEVSSVAAYRDHWRIEGQRPLGPVSDEQNTEQMDQRKRALAAAHRARAISAASAGIQPTHSGLGVAHEFQQDIRL